MGTIQNFFSYPINEYHQLREVFDLLTLVNQSYQALNIGNINDIPELRMAIEDVSSVKKQVMEKQYPADTESLGLAAALITTEEVDTYERMVSFFHKRKPSQGIPWERFAIKDGQLLLKEEI